MINRIIFWNVSTIPAMTPEEYVLFTGDPPMSDENFRRVVNLGKRKTAHKLVLRRYTDLADDVATLLDRVRKIMDAGIEIEAREAQTLSEVIQWSMKSEKPARKVKKPMGRPGIPHEAIDEILLAYDDGYSVGDIHKLTGRPQSTISQVLKRLRPDREIIHRRRKPRENPSHHVRHH